MKKKKSKKPISMSTLLSRYRDPLKAGSLGGITRFAKANKISIRRVDEMFVKLNTDQPRS